MATNASLLVLIDAAIEARLAGRPVESYSLPNGTNLKYDDIDKLLAARDRLISQARQDAGPRTVRGATRARTY